MLNDALSGSTAVVGISAEQLGRSCIVVRCMKLRDGLAANLIKSNAGVCFTVNEWHRRTQAKLGNGPRQV